MGEVKRAFNPEFLNRLDEVILFTSLTDDDLLKIIHLMVEQINLNLVSKQITHPAHRRGRQVHPGEDLRRPQLRRASAAPRSAEVHRGPAQRGADPGHARPPRRAGGLPGRHGPLLPPHQGSRRTTGRRRRPPGAAPRHAAVHVLSQWRTAVLRAPPQESCHDAP